MPNSYFIRHLGTRAVSGPLTASQLRAMARSGDLAHEDEISTSADGPWRSAKSVKDLPFAAREENPPQSAALPVLSDAELHGDQGQALSSLAPGKPIDVHARPVAMVAPSTPLAAAAGTAPGVVVVRREGISPSDAVQFAIDRFRLNPVFYMLVSALVALAVNIPGAGFWFIAAPILIGFYQCVRDEATTGRKASFSEVFRGFRQFVPALIIGFWGSLLVALGLAFCCIPGLVLLPVPFLAFIVAGRERLGGLKALTRALRIVEKDPWGLLASCVLLTLIGVSGCLIFYIGVFVTLPIMLLGLYRVADQMLSSEDA